MFFGYYFYFSRVLIIPLNLLMKAMQHETRIVKK